MIDPASLGAAAASTQNDPRCNAALAARQRADAEKADQDQQMAEIRQKGFRTYVRDTLAENFRQKLREKMLKAMGLDENSLAKLPPAARNAIEQSIEEAIKQQLDQETGPGHAKAAASQTRQGGQGGQTGQGGQAGQGGPSQASSPVTAPAQKKSGIAGCPLIPILAWPGGPSLLG